MAVKGRCANVAFTPEVAILFTAKCCLRVLVGNALSSCSVTVEIVSVAWSLLCGVEHLVADQEVFLHDDRSIQFSEFSNSYDNSHAKDTDLSFQMIGRIAVIIKCKPVICLMGMSEGLFQQPVMSRDSYAFLVSVTLYITHTET